MIPVKVVTQGPIPVTLGDQSPIPVSFSSVLVQRVVNEPYEGEYEYTPSEEEQIISIEAKTASQNITIHSVPTDYGRLTWDGGSLRVY